MDLTFPTLSIIPVNISTSFHYDVVFIDNIF